MDKLKFDITFNRNRYSVFIDWGVSHKFRNKNQAKAFIKKFRDVIHDNVLILGAIQSQLVAIRNLYYPFFNLMTKRDLKICIEDFEQSYYFIYGNLAGDNHVQFNQIRVSFNCVQSLLDCLKKDAQVNKRKVMLAQLYPLQKMYDLVLSSYANDIRGLTDGVSYRTELKTINPLDETKNEPKHSIRRQTAS
ncbi:hypothetical protein [Flagellimonas onchidii]|uniref:hypothetical protein n=1 Tax=Flagellimonas onchidii TaxID=2562684 RepID=UPI0010A6886B|nr:hypothetical protein [Allomuricauda onchidii]